MSTASRMTSDRFATSVSLSTSDMLVEEPKRLSLSTFQISPRSVAAFSVTWSALMPASLP